MSLYFIVKGPDGFILETLADNPAHAVWVFTEGYNGFARWHLAEREGYQIRMVELVDRTSGSGELEGTK